MKRLLLPAMLILLIMTACVSNKRFKEQEEIVRSQEAELETMQQEVGANRDSMDELIIRLNSVYEQLLAVTRMQDQIDESASDISSLEREIADLKGQLNSRQKETSGGESTFPSTPAEGTQNYDAYVKYLDVLRRGSAQYATKYELGLLSSVCHQVAGTLKDLTLEVQDISGELEGKVTTDQQTVQTRQAALRSILDRLSVLETDLDAATRQLMVTEPEARDELENLRDRVVGINDGLNGLTSELGQVIVQNQLEAQLNREHAMNKQYQIALAEYYKGNHESSIRLFEDFLRCYPDGPLSPNAEYWIGENYYGAEVYAKALRQFLNVAEKYPGALKGWDARLKAGITHYRMGDPQAAFREFMKIKTEFPEYPEMPLVDFFLEKVRP